MEDDESDWRNLAASSAERMWDKEDEIWDSIAKLCSRKR